MDLTIPKLESRDKQIHIRLTQSELDDLRLLADQYQIGLSELIRQLVKAVQIHQAKGQD